MPAVCSAKLADSAVDAVADEDRRKIVSNHDPTNSIHICKKDRLGRLDLCNPLLHSDASNVESSVVVLGLVKRQTALPVALHMQGSKIDWSQKSNCNRKGMKRMECFSLTASCKENS